MNGHIIKGGGGVCRIVPSLVGFKKIGLIIFLSLTLCYKVPFFEQTRQNNHSREGERRGKEKGNGN